MPRDVLRGFRTPPELGIEGTMQLEEERPGWLDHSIWVEARFPGQKLLQGRSKAAGAHPKGVVGREVVRLAGGSPPSWEAFPIPPLLPREQQSPSEARKVNDTNDIQVLEAEKASLQLSPSRPKGRDLLAFRVFELGGGQRTTDQSLHHRLWHETDLGWNFCWFYLQANHLTAVLQFPCGGFLKQKMQRT